MKEAPSNIRSTGVLTTVVQLFDVAVWSLVTLFKASTGTVVVGTDRGLTAALNGGGIALPVDVPIRLLLAPSTVLFAVGSTDGEVVSYHIQSIDILAQMLAALLPAVPTAQPSPSAQDFWKNLSAKRNK